MADASSREDMARLAYESQMLKAQESGLREQLSALQSTSVQLSSAQAALAALQAGSAGFVQLGAGILVPAAFSGGTVLVGVGAGVLVEKEPAAALSLVQKRLAEVSETGKKLAEAHLRTVERMRAVETRARSIMQVDPSAHSHAGHSHEHGIDCE